MQGAGSPALQSEPAGSVLLVHPPDPLQVSGASQPADDELPQGVPEDAMLALQVPDPLQVSAPLHVVLVLDPHAVPLAL
jgi:hypothetical protein